VLNIATEIALNNISPTIPLMAVPTPIVPVQLPSLTALGLELYVKRDDLIHPLVIGNKLRKSSRHFEVIQREGYNAVLTFGGRFSNHLLAVAQAGQILGVATTGVVRGTDELGESAVLDECRRTGMQIIEVETGEYYPLQQLAPDALRARLGLTSTPYLIPEGGASMLAIEGVGQIINEIVDLDTYTHIVCAVGTGTTAAGLAWGLAQQSEQRLPTVLALSALRGYTTLPEQGRSALRDKVGAEQAEQILAWHLQFEGSAPFGRYGKPADSVMKQLHALQGQLTFPLDFVYTGKALLQLEQLAASGRFVRGSRLLFLHTGGYQTAPLVV